MDTFENSLFSSHFPKIFHRGCIDFKWSSPFLPLGKLTKWVRCGMITPSLYAEVGKCDALQQNRKQVLQVYFEIRTIEVGVGVKNNSSVDFEIFFTYVNYRLIAAYLLLRVNLDKIMHALRFWCVKCTNPKGECIGQASKLKRKCIILSKFSSTK